MFLTTRELTGWVVCEGSGSMVGAMYGELVRVVSDAPPSFGAPRPWKEEVRGE